MSPSNLYNPIRQRLLWSATIVLVLLALLYGIWWFIHGSHFISTEDAYVTGNVIQITPQIGGTIIAIEADSTETVHAGQTLIKIDPTDSEIILQQAKAQLAQTVRQINTYYVQNEALVAETEGRAADIERVQAELTRAQNDLKRRQSLTQSGGVSGEEILHAGTALKTAQSQLAQARAALAVARAKQATNQSLTNGTSVAHHPNVLIAAAQLRQAWINRSRVSLPAPVDGMIATRNVQIGQRVAPGTPLMTIVPLDQLWVDANFKENQLRNLRIGQPVSLRSDLYGNKVIYHGRVTGIGAGTGSAFALLPAQNASGNWIKIVQRVPVRIALNPKEIESHPLRIGLSMSVEVDISESKASSTAKPRTVSAWSTKAFNASNAEVDAIIQHIVQANLSQ